MNTLLCLLFLIKLVPAQELIGSQCGSKNEKMCVKIGNCPEALDLIKNRLHHKIETCGWEGRTQITCCGLSKSRPTTERRAEQECMNYGSTDDLEILPFLINGVNATLGDYPHMAAIGYESGNESYPYDWNCAGSLISENYILVAAHCLAVRANIVIVRLGKIDLFGNEDNTAAQDIPIKAKDLIPHPEYNHFKRENDIALIRLSKPAQFTKNVRPACLYAEHDTPIPLYTSGWRDRFLQQEPVERIDLTSCNATYVNSPSKHIILPSQLCALREYIDNSDRGYGGPIQTSNRKDYGTRHMIVGVTSFGAYRASKIPDVYTRVSYYLDWIESIVWP